MSINVWKTIYFMILLPSTCDDHDFINGPPPPSKHASFYILRALATFSSLDDDMAFILREAGVDLQAVPAKLSIPAQSTGITLNSAVVSNVFRSISITQRTKLKEIWSLDYELFNYELHSVLQM